MQLGGCGSWVAVAGAKCSLQEKVVALVTFLIVVTDSNRINLQKDEFILLRVQEYSAS